MNFEQLLETMIKLRAAFKHVHDLFKHIVQTVIDLRATPKHISKICDNVQNVIDLGATLKHILQYPEYYRDPSNMHKHTTMCKMLLGFEPHSNIYYNVQNVMELLTRFEAIQASL